jgi:hypothetical protein
MTQTTPSQRALLSRFAPVGVWRQITNHNLVRQCDELTPNLLEKKATNYGHFYRLTEEGRAELDPP